jgi:hypothetical protein
MATTASISGGVATAPAVGVDRRQEGMEGARSRLRSDKDGGGSKKGRNGDGSAFYRCGEGVEEGGQWDAATRRGEAGDRRRSRAARGSQHRPRAGARGWAVGGRMRQGRPDADRWAPATVPAAVKFNLKSNSN